MSSHGRSFSMTVTIETVLIQELLQLLGKGQFGLWKWVEQHRLNWLVQISLDGLSLPWHATPHVHYQLQRVYLLSCTIEIPTRPNVRLLAVRSAARCSCTCAAGAAPTMVLMHMAIASESETIYKSVN